MVNPEKQWTFHLHSKFLSCILNKNELLLGLHARSLWLIFDQVHLIVLLSNKVIVFISLLLQHLPIIIEDELVSIELYAFIYVIDRSKYATRSVIIPSSLSNFILLFFIFLSIYIGWFCLIFINLSNILLVFLLIVYHFWKARTFLSWYFFSICPFD